MIVNDLFCGGGGMGLAFKQAGYTIGGSWDYDPFVVKAYNQNVEDHAVVANIRSMTWKDMPKADVWSFGFPCVDLSQARVTERKKLDGDGSGTFWEVMRLLKEMEAMAPENMPDVLLVENVEKLAEVMGTLEAEFRDRGFRLYAKLFDSKYWGVPQTRPRWYVVGVRDGILGDFEFPEQIEDPMNVPNLLSILEPEPDPKYFYPQFGMIPKEYTPRPGELWEVGELDNGGKWLSIMRRVYSPESIICTLHTSQGGHRQAKIVDPKTGKIRKLTPREYARGQGFPEDYEINVSDSQAYKIFGNAVTVPLAKAVAEKIKEFLEIHRPF